MAVVVEPLSRAAIYAARPYVTPESLHPFAPSKLSGDVVGIASIRSAGVMATDVPQATNQSLAESFYAAAAGVDALTASRHALGHSVDDSAAITRHAARLSQYAAFGAVPPSLYSGIEPQHRFAFLAKHAHPYTAVVGSAMPAPRPVPWRAFPYNAAAYN